MGGVLAVLAFVDGRLQLALWSADQLYVNSACGCDLAVFPEAVLFRELDIMFLAFCVEFR